MSAVPGPTVFASKEQVAGSRETRPSAPGAPRDTSGRRFRSAVLAARKGCGINKVNFRLLVLAAASIAAGACAADGPEYSLSSDNPDGGSRQGQFPPLLEAGPSGSTDVTLPCDGADYAQLDSGPVFAYTVDIHSENTDLTEMLATGEYLTARAMGEVLRVYQCEELMAGEVEGIEEKLKLALENHYLERTGEKGVIDTLVLVPQNCS